ncbi:MULTISPECIES: formate dehydrogenase subunit gamma [Paracoccus]|uniref:formate dehydrogenase subunit gamma n=1 Tax=Paracoccus TaxID=265 RepID=UPI000781F338|nr:MULTISPECIES: formate dehydrogenase subunit gamma [Paracoccus]MCV2446505.1 formate dehydrogenase subunit gamma [Paracoccus sp. DMF]MDQ7775449.1 formate dehydrogenase subunit gamma [Paracoccus aminovorans]
MTSPASDADFLLRLDAIIAAHAGREGPLLPILHDIQAEWGYVPEEAQPVIAGALGMTRAEVYGVVSFYHDFRDHPSGRHVLRLCRAEACQSMGADELADRVRAALGIDFHQTTPDGRLTLEPVFCLGLCACGPSAQMGERLLGRATVEKVQRLVAEAGMGAGA